MINTAKARTARVSVRAMVEDIVGCKWSLEVLGALRSGILRPGKMERSVTGLTAKVLNERLRKLTRYGIVQRIPFPEVPPRVEYRLTPFGRRFAAILDQIDRLEDDRPIRQGLARVQRG
jgi:DNA-binding HxlR family transcriptional regulator